MPVKRIRGGHTLFGIVAIATGVLWSWTARLEQTDQREPLASSPQLVSIAALPEAGDSCQWEPKNDFFPDFLERSVYAAPQEAATTDITRPPVRNILDTDPVYTAVAVDPRFDEVFLYDSNTWSMKVFNRLDNTPPTASRTEPKRVLVGPKSHIQFNSDIHIDPKSGDIYTVENDIGSSLFAFSRNAAGDTAPLRSLRLAQHRAYAMAFDEEREEMFVSTQSPPRVEVFRKMASGEEKPLRVLRGDRTRLADAHGIAVDVKNKWLFVNNWGTIHDPKGGGGFDAPSITVYPLDASGDTAPIRVIQGPKTQLNWPGIMLLNPATGELFVANTVDGSILVFRGTDRGDVAPTRVIKGNRTGLSHPMGVALDAKNQELWVANLGNASATAYSLSADGDAAPLRTIRSAPRGKRSLRFGKTVALTYDSKREEILVPN